MEQGAVEDFVAAAKSACAITGRNRLPVCSRCTFHGMVNDKKLILPLLI